MKSQNTNSPHPKTNFRTAYSPKSRQQIHFTGPSRTKQSFKDECDINTIMRRYQSTGILPDLMNQKNPQFLDVTGIDYQEAMQTVAEAHSLFQELPSRIRNRFKNDPAEFLAFTSDEKNRQELAEMGLLSPEAMERMANPQSEPGKTVEAPPVPSADNANNT